MNLLNDVEATTSDIKAFAIQRKTRRDLERELARYVTLLYENEIELFIFVDTTAKMIEKQLREALVMAITAFDVEDPEEELNHHDLWWFGAIVAAQMLYLMKLGSDVVRARNDGEPLSPILERIAIWGARFDEVYNEAMIKLAGPTAVLQWRMGERKEHCSTCLTLSDVIATALHWQLSGWKPQSRDLECGGWKCGCRFHLLPASEVKKLEDAGWVSVIPVV